MSTFAPEQIPKHSYDAHAVSVSVANRSLTDGRLGSFFDNDFVAVSPVHFHNLGNGKFFGIFSQRWHTVTPDTSDPNLFSEYSLDTSPTWAIFDGANGHRHAVPGQSLITPDTGISHDDRSVVGACSRTDNYLYLLQSITRSGTAVGSVSHFHISPITGEVNLVGEEEIPSIQTKEEETVIFNRGVRLNSIYLIFAGSDSAGKIYLSRKNWGQIGAKSKIEYQSDKGWTEDQSKIVPLKTPDGYLTTAGPVSFADYRNKTWISVVKDDDGEMSAQLYSSSGLWDLWKPENYPYPLGTQGTTYMGGTVYLQPMLRANPSAVSKTCVAAIPMVSAVVKVSGESSGIDLKWDLWPIPSESRINSSDAFLEVAAQTETAES